MSQNVSINKQTNKKNQENKTTVKANEWGAQCADQKIGSVTLKCKQRMFLQKVQREAADSSACLSLV